MSTTPRKFLKHIDVPESQDSKPAPLQVSRSFRIGCLIFREVVLAAIKLDNQPTPIAGEVGDMIADRHLPAKMIALALEQAQLMPQSTFCIGRIAAQVTCKKV